MAIFTDDTKGPLGSVHPTNAVDGSPLGRLEPLLTPEQLTRRFLFGIPLVSASRNPITERYDVMTEEHLQDFIISAVNRVESDLGVDVYPVTRDERHPYDGALFNSYMYFRVERPPIQRLHKLAVTPSTGHDLFVVPLGWVDRGHFLKGQINIIPMATHAVGLGDYMPVSPGGAHFIQILGRGGGWLPSFFTINYTSGFVDEAGRVPRILNDLIGIYAAIEALDNLGATNRQAAFSLSLDGMSQSVNTPGVQVYAQRIQKLEEQKVVILNKLKAKLGTKLFSGTL